MALEWLKKLFGGGKKEEVEMQAQEPEAQAPEVDQQPAVDMGETPDVSTGEGQESSENQQWK